MKTPDRRKMQRYSTLLLAASLSVLTACSSSDDDDSAAIDEVPAATDGTDADGDDADGADGTDGDGDSGLAGGIAGLAVVSGATPTFDAGQIEQFTIGDEITASGTYPATLSDIVVRTDGTDVYQVGRFNIDSITRFTTDEFATPVYQYSVLQGETTPNTFDIVFASDTKAYVLQDGGTDILIVNPEAATEEEFITGAIDISVYDADAPNAVSGVIANGNLFVLMQRLTPSGFSFVPDQPGYVAVFDVETDEEIATGQGADGLEGIELNTTNPLALQYVESLNEIVVTGRGNIFGEFNDLEGDPFVGGIEVIDVDSFENELLLDDGTEDDNNGFFNGSLVVSDERGYIITSEGFQNNTLRSYNPTTGVLDEGIVAGLEGMDVITLGAGPLGRVWVAVGGVTPGFILIDPADNSVVGDQVLTEFVPNTVVFIGSDS